MTTMKMNKVYLPGLLLAALVLGMQPCGAQYRQDTASLAAPGTDTSARSGSAADTSLFFTKTWTLQDCISYALEENLSLKQSRLSEQNAEIDMKTAKNALFPNLSFSTSHSLINRPYQESSSTVSGTEILHSDSNTSYTGNYGLNARWDLFTGGRNRKTIKQEDINMQIAGLETRSTANNILENIAQVYVQILFADESVKVNENTLEVSRAQCARGSGQGDSLSECHGNQAGNRIRQARYLGFGARCENSTVVILPDTEPECGHRHQPYQRHGLHLRGTDQERMEQFRRPHPECAYFQQPADKERRPEGGAAA